MEPALERKPSRTDVNLWTAFIGEAKANRMYTAYAMKAMEEGYPEAAQIFLEVAGSETVHAMQHLKALKEVKSTEENLERVVTEEAYEAQTMYPRMLKEAEEDGRPEAVASFRLAMEREVHHRRLFQEALEDIRRRVPASASRAETTGSEAEAAVYIVESGPSAEVFQEKARIVAIERLREVIFGAQDGLISTTAMVASVTGATSSNAIVIIAGLAAALGGMISMGAGSYMSSKAESEVHLSELRHEAAEIASNPAEEMAELVEIYQREGMSYDEALRLANRISQDQDLWLKTMAEKELGLSQEVTELESPLKDSMVMAGSFIVGAVIPVLPYFIMPAESAMFLAVGLALLTLFVMGAVKGKMVRKSMLRSGLEITAIGTAAALLGYGLGVAAPEMLGIKIPQG